LSPINNSSCGIIYIIYPSSTQVTYCSSFWKSDLRIGQLFMLCVLGGTSRVILNHEFERMLNGCVTDYFFKYRRPPPPSKTIEPDLIKKYRCFCGEINSCLCLQSLVTLR
jgi:hypothetical protein